MDHIDLVTTYGGKTSASTLLATEWNKLITQLQTSINGVIDSSSPELEPTSNFYVNGVLTAPTNGVVTLTPNASYVLEGTLYGQVIIDATGTAPTDNTLIALNGVHIITDKSAAIKYATPLANTGYKDLVVNLRKDTNNVLICTTVVPRADEQEACLYSMNNMVVQGVGYLTCINKGGHGIKASELRLTGPNVYIEASHDAIHGNTKLTIDDGTYHVNKANDAFGTGTSGTMYIFGGTFYAYNIDGKVFDGQLHTYIFDSTHKIDGTDVLLENQYANKALVYSSPNLYFGESANATITEYTTVTKNEDGTWTGTGTAVALDANNIYQVTKKFVEIKGYITHPINMPSTLSDVEFRMDNAYIINNASSIPTIYYQSTDSKIKLWCAQDTINMVINTVVGDTTVDIDAVKSESNISIEVKNGGHLLVTSSYADGLDGGDVKITDTKGVLLAMHNGGRGIKGSCVIIGPNAETTKSVITSYYTDSTDTANYSTMDGAVVALNNCLKFAVSIGKTDTEAPTDYKLYGYADVYSRNGKATKGTFGTVSSCLKGVFICDSFAAVIGIDFNKSPNIYYSNMVSTGSSPFIGDCGKTYKSYECLPYNEAPIPARV